MEVNRIPAGRNPPNDVKMIVEIPERSEPAKHKLHDELCLIRVDRFFAATTRFPGRHAFIPTTSAAASAPCDVLLVSEPPLSPGALVCCRPLGALLLSHERSSDKKIVVVPVDDLNPLYGEAHSYADLPQPALRRIERSEAGKCVSPATWVDAAAARDLIVDAIARAQPALRQRLRRSA